jgi:hypothetical protein
VDKYVHFGRALDEIAELRREGFWDENYSVFASETRTISGADVGAQASIDLIEGIVRPARAALLLSPFVLDLASRKEAFYFVLLIDHENFWDALVRHIRKTCPDIVSYRSHPRSTFSFFQPDRPHGDQKEEALLGRIDRESYKAYVGEHRGLARYVISKLCAGVDKSCGVSLFDYGEAVAYWRFFPESHSQEFKNRGLDALEPDLPEHKGSEAADRKISRHMTTKIWEMAEAQNKRPFFMLVSGDSDYLETLYDLRRRGADCQYWLFRSQLSGTGPGSTRLRGLGEDRLVWLDDLIDGLNKTSPEMLAKWRSQR